MDYSNDNDNQNEDALAAQQITELMMNEDQTNQLTESTLSLHSLNNTQLPDDNTIYQGNALNTFNKSSGLDTNIKKRHRKISDPELNAEPVRSKRTNQSPANPDHSLPLNNKYNQNNKGPFEIIIEHDRNSDLPAPSHYLTLCKIINTILKKNNLISYLKNTRQLGKKVSLILNTKSAANALVNHQDFKDKGLLAYIPTHRMVCYGIIKDIPAEFPMEDLKEGTQSIVEIVSYERCQMATMEDNTRKYVPSKSIKLIFAGQIRPNQVSIYNVIHKIHPYVSPVKRCTNCLRFNHSAKDCKSPPRCKHCGEIKTNHPDENTCPYSQLPPKCANCKGPHNAMSSDCPILHHLKAIHKVAAANSISYNEAKDIIANPNNNTPNPANLQDYPQLPRLQPLNPNHHYDNLSNQGKYQHASRPNRYMSFGTDNNENPSKQRRRYNEVLSSNQQMEAPKNNSNTKNYSNHTNTLNPLNINSQAHPSTQERSKTLTRPIINLTQTHKYAKMKSSPAAEKDSLAVASHINPNLLANLLTQISSFLGNLNEKLAPQIESAGLKDQIINIQQACNLFTSTLALGNQPQLLSSPTPSEDSDTPLTFLE